MDNNQLNIQTLKSTIAKGEIKPVLNTMISAAQSNNFLYNPELYLIANRFESLEKDKLRRTISNDDYNIELNKITYNLLDILDTIGKEEKTISPKEIAVIQKRTIDRLIVEFEQSRAIKSRASKLRTKNHVSRKIGNLFLKNPDLLAQFQTTEKEGIISGICHKIKLLPEFGDLDLLATLAKEDLGNFTKGNIVNALAEIIYNGKLGIGEDTIVQSVLKELGKTGDVPLQKNIERVAVALDYLTGRVDKPDTPSLLSEELYTYDNLIHNVIIDLNELIGKKEKLSLSNFLQIVNKLFNRMTFRGEQKIETCRSQRWSKRVHSALMSHQVLLRLERLFIPLASKKQQKLYQSLLLSLSQYIDSMIAYLFKDRKVEESEIRELIGQGAFITRFKENTEILFEQTIKKEGNEEIPILLIPEAQKNEINKYLQCTIAIMDELISKQ